MRIDVHHFHHFDESGATSAKLDLILARINSLGDQLRVQGAHMSAELDTLTQKVSEATTVEQSAIELLNGLGAKIAELKDDPVQLQALSDSLSAKSAELAAAVTANTPAVA